MTVLLERPAATGLPPGAIPYPHRWLCPHGHQYHRPVDEMVMICPDGCRSTSFPEDERRLTTSTFSPGSPQRSTMYLSGCEGQETAAVAVWQPQLGVLAQPGNAIHRRAHLYNRWAIDNGVFGVALQHYQGKRRDPWNDDDTERYLAYLRKVVSEVDTSRVLFATAPDHLTFVDNPNPVLAAQRKQPVPIGCAERTWERSRQVFDEIRSLGLKVALVAQDGIRFEHPTHLHHWDRFDAIFLGGSDEFKLGVEAEMLTKTAWMYRKWVHMGRVSSLKRMKIAQRMGCDSADGTYLGFGPAKNLPNVLNWLDRTSEPLPCTTHWGLTGSCGCPPLHATTTPFQSTRSAA